MNAYSQRMAKPTDWVQALLLSVLLHFAVIAIFVGLLMVETFVVTAAKALTEEPEAEVYLELRPEMFTKVVAPTKSVPMEDKNRFITTKESQDSEVKPANARYFGERNTAAASEGEVVEDALAVPSQDGYVPRQENEMELLETDFSDGDFEGDAGAQGEQGPLAEELAVVEEEERPAPLEEKEPTAEERLEKAKQEARELLSTEDSLPMPEKEDLPESMKEVAEEDKIPEPKEKVDAKTGAGGDLGEVRAEKNYEREARKTTLHGSIRRSGESAVNVEDTLRGRYLAAVNKEIEKAWQRECIMRREHILPGVLTVRFIVDGDGEVTGFRFASEVGGSEIQKGFTMQSVKRCDLPPMSAELKNELEGEPLEMMLTFYF